MHAFAQIGENAGKVWRILGKNGEVPLANLPKLTGLKEAEAFLAVGWLARENKIKLDSKKENHYVALTEGEQNAYKRMSSK
jgi:hypothetical protein